MHRNKNSVIPWFPDPGKGVLNAGDIGKYLDPFLGEIAQKKPCHPEKVRVSRSQHHHSLLRCLQIVEHYGEVIQRLLFPFEIREDIKMSLVTDENFRLVDHFQCLGAKSFPSSDPRAN